MPKVRDVSHTYLILFNLNIIRLSNSKSERQTAYFLIAPSIKANHTVTVNNQQCLADRHMQVLKYLAQNCTQLSRFDWLIE